MLLKSEDKPSLFHFFLRFPTLHLPHREGIMKIYFQCTTRSFSTQKSKGFVFAEINCSHSSSSLQILPHTLRQKHTFLRYLRQKHTFLLSVPFPHSPLFRFFGSCSVVFRSPFVLTFRFWIGELFSMVTYFVSLISDRVLIFYLILHRWFRGIVRSDLGI